MDDVRLATKDDGSYRGYGHVEFVSEEAASKPLGKNGQDLLGHPIRLDFSTKRGAPGSKLDFKRNLAVLYLLGDLIRIKRRMIFEISC